ncbi:DEAD/DEAH box helicase family protein [Psychrobacillus sp. BM2]|uniref:DEAD/DEAH box helicase family protein n=1 Tax=Psychrobacillus sp. BM2 TaxID=3400421 RepID=UPI003B02DEAD
MRVSEKVTIKEIESWSSENVVLIKAGTGAGKSYFVKNNLYAIAKRDKKRILMLIHRRNCVDQFQMEIEELSKTDVIDIRTYQSIEAVERGGVIYELRQYDYIICDEFHYFMGDAAFNKYTDLSLNAILEQTNAIKIFMSATGDNMKHYLSDSKHKGLATINYELPLDFSFIKHLEFFYKDATLETYIEDVIKHNKKAIFFIQSATKAYELHKKYKDHSLFNCGKGDKHYKHVEEEKINELLKNERFEELILFTTSVMDAGVNIHDDELNHIFVDVDDTGTLIQCIGRKRLKGKDDYIVLHVKAIGKQQLGGLETQNRKKMQMGYYFKEHGQKKFVREYYRENDKSHIVYDEPTKDGIEKKLNELMFFKVVTDLIEIERMKENGYIPYMKELFGIEEYSVFEEDEKKESLEVYLDKMVGKVMLQAEDRNELVEVLNVRDGRNNRLLRGIETLNGMLKENKINYLIDQFETSKTVDGKRKKYKSAWRVRRLSDC